MPIADLICPGPQPLTDASQLIGRDAETAEIVRACDQNHVIEVTAISGAGKTSFVRAGLVPKLEENGIYVPSYGTWATATAKLRAAKPENATAAAAMLYRIWIGQDPFDYRSLGEILREAAAGRRVVVVLDQVEELLRFRPTVGADLLRLAGTTAKRTRIPHVVVARSEYRERLQPVEVPGADVWPIPLTELDTDPVLEAIARSLLHVPAVGVTLDKDARKLLVTWWQTARTPATFDGAAQTHVGLTHLQALVWSFKAWAVDNDRGHEGEITVELLEEFRSSRASTKAKRLQLAADDESMRGGGEWLLTEALLHYLGERAGELTEPQAVAVPGDPDGDVPADPHRKLLWRNGPQLMLARIAPAMSAGGYKQPQSLFSLVPHALGDELTQRGAADLARDLQREPLRVRKLCRAFAVKGAGIAERWGPNHEESAHAVGERLVAEEMIDCLRAALKQMTRANVLREFEQDDPIYELVHDSMGAALNTWAQSFLETPIATIGVVAPQPGRIVATSIDGADFMTYTDSELERWGAERDRKTGEVILAALKWPGSLIKGDPPIVMRNVRFQRCDFTSAFFEDCRFENVTFESCKLRAAGMLGCTFKNVRFTAPPEGPQQDLSLLTIIAPEAGVDTMFERAEATGVFLQGIGDGDWKFENVIVHHLVIEAAEPARFQFTNSIADAVSVSGAAPEIWNDDDVASTIRRVDLIDRVHPSP